MVTKIINQTSNCGNRNERLVTERKNFAVAANFVGVVFPLQGIAFTAAVHYMVEMCKWHKPSTVTVDW